MLRGLIARVAGDAQPFTGRRISRFRQQLTAAAGGDPTRLRPAG